MTEREPYMPPAEPTIVGEVGSAEITSGVGVGTDFTIYASTPPPPP